jgi:hypothetical protein
VSWVSALSVQAATPDVGGCPLRWQARDPDVAVIGTGVLREQQTSRFRIRANNSQIFRRGQL